MKIPASGFPAIPVATVLEKNPKLGKVVLKNDARGNQNGIVDLEEAAQLNGKQLQQLIAIGVEVTAQAELDAQRAQKEASRPQTAEVAFATLTAALDSYDQLGSSELTTLKTAVATVAALLGERTQPSDLQTLSRTAGASLTSYGPLTFEPTLVGTARALQSALGVMRQAPGSGAAAASLGWDAELTTKT